MSAAASGRRESRAAGLPASLASIIAWDAVTSLGESAAETALLLRAGLCNVRESHFIDHLGARVRTCASPALPADLIGMPRLVALAGHAIRRVHARVTQDLPAQSVPILVALPERFQADVDPPGSRCDGDAFVEALRAELPDDLHTSPVECFPMGRAGGAPALRRAVEILRRGAASQVYVGGVDSYHEWPILEALERDDRLLTAENLDGLRPGEGAAFAAVALPGSSLRLSLDVGVLGIGLGREPHPVGSETPSRAAGLTAALRTAVGPLRDAGVRSDFWLTDTRHERYGTKELQTIIARFGDVLGLEGSIGMPLKELGDVGAAAVPLLCALAAQAWLDGQAPDDVAVITACSDGGGRGALLLAREH